MYEDVDGIQHLFAKLLTIFAHFCIINQQSICLPFTIIIINTADTFYLGDNTHTHIHKQQTFTSEYTVHTHTLRSLLYVSLFVVTLWHIWESHQ